MNSAAENAWVEHVGAVSITTVDVAEAWSVRSSDHREGEPGLGQKNSGNSPAVNDAAQQIVPMRQRRQSVLEAHHHSVRLVERAGTFEILRDRSLGLRVALARL